jgi:hypothetical protein
MSEELIVLSEDTRGSVGTREIHTSTAEELGLGGEEFVPWQLGAVL